MAPHCRAWETAILAFRQQFLNTKFTNRRLEDFQFTIEDKIPPKKKARKKKKKKKKKKRWMNSSGEGPAGDGSIFLWKEASGAREKSVRWDEIGGCQRNGSRRMEACRKKPPKSEAKEL